MQLIKSLGVALFIGFAFADDTPTPVTNTPVPTSSDFPSLPSCVQPAVYSILRTNCFSWSNKECICTKARPQLEQAVRQGCTNYRDVQTANSIINSYCAGVTPTPTPPTSTPSPPANTPGNFPTLPSCVQGNVYGILRTNCFSSFTQQCYCTTARPSLQQAIRQNCNPRDEQAATSIINSYCTNITPTPTPTPQPPTPTPGSCNKVNPTIFDLPSCAQSCATQILRGACGVFDNASCTCAQRGNLNGCIRGACNIDDQNKARSTLDAICAGNPGSVSCSSVKTVTATVCPSKA